MANRLFMRLVRCGRFIALRGFPVLVALALAACATAPAPLIVPAGIPRIEDAKKGHPVKVAVFYGTNRTPVARPVYFDDNEATQVQYGYTLVSLPWIHEKGEVETPTVFDRDKSNPDKFMLLLDAVPLRPEEFIVQVNRSFGAAPRKNIGFVFVHGFNVPFRDAALRTAQLAVDMQLPVVPAFFSWPSNGESPVEGTANYLRDFTKAISSIPALEEFLVQFGEKTRADEIFVLAHSMGSWTTTHALMSLALNRPKLTAKVKLVTLAAPDIDARVFTVQIAPAMVKAGYAVNLYASDNDKALNASRIVWGRARAGIAGTALALSPGIETVDASDISTDVLGHSKYGDSPVLLRDMALFYSGMRASQRPGLTMKRLGEQNYWQIQTPPR
ncbi:esterase/lipase superfamily enzyme [Variovorax sp. SG517]|uniref:alpha/beta hydrolase n=1 Tax=Variovorax sp. SG517 TaxID=2587117 RepID=UPI00159E7094|nr:alpha/beta hydrolase [Variovorax sp. SG517]NVM92695.1 esterase/lipase superfamily enzyme [Variovorax sp. SG517]